MQCECDVVAIKMQYEMHIASAPPLDIASTPHRRRQQHTGETKKQGNALVEGKQQRGDMKIPPLKDSSKENIIQYGKNEYVRGVYSC